VGTGRRTGALGVAGFDGGDDPLVLTDGEAAVAFAGPHVGPVQVRLAVEAGQRVTERPVAGGVADQGVELQVQLGVAVRVSRLLE
jgi:hypothetical protein